MNPKIAVAGNDAASRATRRWKTWKTMKRRADCGYYL